MAVLGGSETYGKFVGSPYSNLLSDALKEPVVNLGVMHAGLTLIADDPAILGIASQARLTVIQVLGAQNMSNRFYSVHPRRNDRFLGAADRLQNLFPSVDFTDFHFTGHLLSTLEKDASPAFDDLVAELKKAWVNRMRLILREIRGETVLLWMSERRPEDASTAAQAIDPLFVDRDMLEALSPMIGGIVEVVASDTARSEGLDGMHFWPSDEQAAAAMPGPIFHAETAAALQSVIADPFKKRRAGDADAPPNSKNALPPRVSRSTRAPR